MSFFYHDALGMKTFNIENRRYLGNKKKLLPFINEVVAANCFDCTTFLDLFSGTGVVANYFSQQYDVITNDILKSNYIIHHAFFANGDYDSEKLISLIDTYNQLNPSILIDNYYSQNYANTFLSEPHMKIVGFIRDDIDRRFNDAKLTLKEKNILITSLLYAVDKIANTVGHYDAFRKNVPFDKTLILLMPNITPQGFRHKVYNQDANELIKTISADIIYIDPPYNSRQYSNLYHFLENLAENNKPELFGVTRKMDRTHLKSDYCTQTAPQVFNDLINNIKARYILVSYNDTGDKASGRSNAKIADEQIIETLERKGKVHIFETDFKAFSTGKSKTTGLKERLFLCVVDEDVDIPSPLNYTGGKFKLLPQIKPLMPSHSNCFYDLFCGGANVGVNANAKLVHCVDKNDLLIELYRELQSTRLHKIMAIIDNYISYFGFSDTMKHGYDYYDCNSSEGLAKFNKVPYELAREQYNKDTNNYLLLFTLMIFAFNNQFRFNQRGRFNSPVGKRDFNAKMRMKLTNFVNRIQEREIYFDCMNFRDMDVENLAYHNAFVYLDPPYILGTATYNESNGWNKQDETDLLDFLTECDKHQVKFALSNVIEHKNQTHTQLINWVRENKFNCHLLNISYANSNYQVKDKTFATKEVLITNY